MSGETKSHRELKRAALVWAQARGFRIAGLEIRVPNSAYRADVAAYRPGDEEGAGPAAAVFECKQARSDFLNDSRPIRETLEQLEALHARRLELERSIGRHYPTLRDGDSLFPEYCGCDGDQIGHEGHRKLVREIRVLENHVYGRTKFSRMVKYRCAHLYYLVTAPDIVAEHEVPADWGWLELAVDGALVLRKMPVLQEVPEARAGEWLHRLASSGTWQFNKREGITFEEVEAVRRREGNAPSFP